MFQITDHHLIGQLRVVRAVAMVTGIDGQHLTGQRTVRTLGLEGIEVQRGFTKTFWKIPLVFFLLLLACGPVKRNTKAALCARGGV